MAFGAADLLEDLVDLDLKILGNLDASGHIARGLFGQGHQVVSSGSNARVGAIMTVLITELADHHLGIGLDGRHSVPCVEGLDVAGGYARFVIYVARGWLGFCNVRRLNE